MGAILVLEDGRALYCSTVGMAGMLGSIADEIPETHAVLARWLRDVSERPAPFLDFDMRSLSVDHKMVFWNALGRAFDTRERLKGPHENWPDNHFSSHCMRRLRNMHASILRGEPPTALSDFDEPIRFEGTRIDLAELWFD